MRKEASQLSVHVKPCRKFLCNEKQFYTKCSPCEFSIITDALNHSHTLSCLISELFTHEKDFRRYTHHRNILCQFMSSTKTKISLRFWAHMWEFVRLAATRKNDTMQYSSNIDKNFKYFYGFIFDISKTLIVLQVISETTLYIRDHFAVFQSLNSSFLSV